MEITSTILSMHFVSVRVVEPYRSTDTATAWKKPRIILAELSDFYMTDSLSIAVHDFARRMLTLLLFDEILLPRCMDLSTDPYVVLLKVPMNSVLFTI